MEISDIITIIGMVVGVLGIVFGLKNAKKFKKSESDKQNIYNHAQKIIQHNYYINAPEEVKRHFVAIVESSGHASSDIMLE